jgi:predicted phosphodiesterase
MPRKSPKKSALVDNLLADTAAEREREYEASRVRSAARAQERAAVLEKRVRDLESQLAHMQDVREILAQIEANPLERFAFAAREKTSRVHEAVAVQILSDLHLEETVRPEEVNGVNEFNLEIASDSMDRLAVGTSWLLDLCRAKKSGVGYQIRDLLLPCLGDVISNYLREEDLTGNFLTPSQAVIFAEEQLVKYVRHVLHRCPWIESVYMPFVSGNHDRLSFSKSTPFRGRQNMSLTVMLAHGVARELRDEPRVKVELATAEHHYTTVYDHTIRGMHGDRFNYQGGVGGLYIPARRHIAGLNKQIKAHVTFFGHWHTSKEDDDWVSNGSLIGPNAYSIGKALDPEPPSQTFLLLDKVRGKRMCTPVHCRQREEWS